MSTLKETVLDISVKAMDTSVAGISLAAFVKLITLSNATAFLTFLWVAVRLYLVLLEVRIKRKELNR